MAEPYFLCLCLFLHHKIATTDTAQLQKRQRSAPPPTMHSSWMTERRGSRLSAVCLSVWSTAARKSPRVSPWDSRNSCRTDPPSLSWTDTVGSVGEGRQEREIEGVGEPHCTNASSYGATATS